MESKTVLTTSSEKGKQGNDGMAKGEEEEEAGWRRGGKEGGGAGVGEVGVVGVQEKHKAWVNTARSASGTN